MIRALDAAGRIEIVATRSGPGRSRKRPDGLQPIAPGDRGARQSRRIVRGQCGKRTEYFAKHCADEYHRGAVRPLMLGQTVAAYLYLDSRGGPGAVPRPLRPNASGFCMALAKLAGLALANLKRLDVERRTVQMEAELHAGMAAQKWILPREPVSAGRIHVRGPEPAW